MADTQTAPAPGPDMAALIGAVRTSSDESRKLAKAEETEMAPVMKKSQDVLESPRPEKPQLAETPKPPKLQEALQENGQKFLVTSMLVAGLVGAFTRGNVTAALSSYGAMNKAFHSGQIEQAEGHYTEWKQSVEQVRDTNQAMLKEYEDALNDRKMSLDELSARMSLIAAKYKDPLMAQAANTQNIAMMGQLYERLHEFNLNYSLDAKKLQTAIDANKLIAQQQIEAAGLDPTTPEGRERLAKLPPKTAKTATQLFFMLHPDKSPANQPKMSTEGTVWAATQYVLTGQMPPMGMGAGADRAAIIEMAPKIASKYGLTIGEAMSLPAERKAEAATLNKVLAWAVGVDRSAEIVDNQLDIAEGYAKQLGLTEVQRVNQALVAGEKEFGSPEANAYASAMLTASTEFARMLTGPLSAGMLTEGAAQAAEGRLNTGLTMGQFGEIKTLFQKEIANIQGASQHQVDRIKGMLRNQVPAANAPAGGHKVGDIISGADGKKYKITGGDPSDPDVEPVP